MIITTKVCANCSITPQTQGNQNVLSTALSSDGLLLDEEFWTMFTVLVCRMVFLVGIWSAGCISTVKAECLTSK